MSTLLTDYDNKTHVPAIDISPLIFNQVYKTIGRKEIRLDVILTALQIIYKAYPIISLSTIKHSGYKIKWYNDVIYISK